MLKVNKNKIFKNIKTISLLLAISISVSFVGCSSNKQAASESKLDKIKKSGKLVLGTSADYPPYEFHKEVDGKDKIVGFDIEVAKSIAKDLGVELEIKDMKFDGLLAALSAEKVDMVIAGMTPTEERKNSVDFSEVYYTAKQSVVVRKADFPKFISVDVLSSMSAGVQKGSIQEKMAKEIIKSKEIKGLGKISDLILEIKNSKVDYIIVETPVANSYVQRNDDLTIANISLKSSDEEGSAAAVKKGNTELIEKINVTLSRLNVEKKIDEFVRNANEQVE